MQNFLLSDWASAQSKVVLSIASDLKFILHPSLESLPLYKVEKILSRQPGFDPIIFTFSENSNYWWESLLEFIRQNIAG